MNREALACISLCFLVGGCHGALSEIKRDTQSLEQEIQEKEQNLQALQEERAELKKVMNALLLELESREVMLADLHSRLATLELENQKIKIDTAIQQAEKDKLDKAIRKYQHEIAELSRLDVTIHRKKQRVEDLRRRIRAHLEIQLREWEDP